MSDPLCCDRLRLAQERERLVYVDDAMWEKLSRGAKKVYRWRCWYLLPYPTTNDQLPSPISACPWCGTLLKHPEND